MDITFHLPIENPVIILALCLMIMLMVPPVCKRVGMPSIFGLIVAGIAIGPKGFNLIGEDSGLQLLSSAGLLYLMFLMTLEIDIYSFRKNRFKSVWFGAFTFVIPFAMGFGVARMLGFEPATALLIACMLASHTLVAYPIATKLGVTRTEPVVVSIGGTIIADLAVLLFLSVIITAHHGEFSVLFVVRTLLLLTGFGFLMLWVFPKVSRWYFASFQHDDAAQYIFILFSLFASGFLAYLARLEPIVGAFLCGLALNRVIPHRSVLMSRTVFIGNSLFIPFFMIQIGMMVDVKAFIQGTDTLMLAGILTVIALAGKYLAAVATRLIYGYSSAEQTLLFGLSSSRAAATIAVVMVGFNLDILNTEILNAAVVLVIATCLAGTFFTDYAGRKVALAHHDTDVDSNRPDRVMTLISNPQSARPLFDFAMMMLRQHEGATIFPLTLSTSPQHLEASMMKDKTLAAHFMQQAAAASVDCHPANRIDTNISEGIVRASVELQASHIVMGWSGQSGAAQYLFGNLVDQLLNHCRQTIVVTRMAGQQVRFRKIFVLVPRYAEHEMGYHSWLTTLEQIRRNASADILFIGVADTLADIAQSKECKSLGSKNFRPVEVMPDMKALASELTPSDLFVIVAARHNSVSFNRDITVMPRVVSRYFSHTGSIILYPEQPDEGEHLAAFE